MRLFSVKNTLVVSAIGLFGLMGSAVAQNVRDEYRECQRAQRQMQAAYNDYERSGSRGDYRDWVQTQRYAQQECAEYQRAQQTNGYYNNGGYNNGGYYNRGGYNNNGYNNNGATIVYDQRTGRYYRVYRGSSNNGYYQTDQRGVEMLRQAVNAGYQQGYRQGQMDRQYGRGGNYNGNNTYNQGSYGYDPYVDRSQYQYYFQQGFQRGYQDGYNSRSQYGYRSNNSMNILGTILNQILRIGQ